MDSVTLETPWARRGAAEPPEPAPWAPRQAPANGRRAGRALAAPGARGPAWSERSAPRLAGLLPGRARPGVRSGRSWHGLRALLPHHRSESGGDEGQTPGLSSGSCRARSRARSRQVCQPRRVAGNPAAARVFWSLASRPRSHAGARGPWLSRPRSRGSGSPVGTRRLRCLGPCHGESPRGSSWLLAEAWPSAGCCSQLEREPAYERLLCVSAFQITF